MASTFASSFLLSLVVLAMGFAAGQLCRNNVTTFVFESFDCLRDRHLKCTGDCISTADGKLNLTSYDTRSWGRLMYSPGIRLMDPATSRVAFFSTNFTFSMKGDYSRPGEGLAFVMQANPSYQGRGGGFLGLYDKDGKAGTPTVAVEFDTYREWFYGFFMFNDMNSNHVGVDIESINSKAQVDAGSVGIDLGREQSVTAWIDYIPASESFDGNLQVRISADNVRPALPLISYNVDLSKHMAEIMHLGFSATTGDHLVTSDCLSYHNILSWSFHSWGLDPDSPPPAPPPPILPPLPPPSVLPPVPLPSEPPTPPFPPSPARPPLTPDAPSPSPSGSSPPIPAPFSSPSPSPSSSETPTLPPPTPNSPGPLPSPDTPIPYLPDVPAPSPSLSPPPAISPSSPSPEPSLAPESVPTPSPAPSPSTSVSPEPAPASAPTPYPVPSPSTPSPNSTVSPSSEPSSPTPASTSLPAPEPSPSTPPPAPSPSSSVSPQPAPASTPIPYPVPSPSTPSPNSTVSPSSEPPFPSPAPTSLPAPAPSPASSPDHPSPGSGQLDATRPTAASIAGFALLFSGYVMVVYNRVLRELGDGMHSHCRVGYLGDQTTIGIWPTMR